MSHRPLTRDFREGPTTDISLVIGFVAAVMISPFMLLSALVFCEKCEVVIKACRTKKRETVETKKHKKIAHETSDLA